MIFKKGICSAFLSFALSGHLLLQNGTECHFRAPWHYQKNLCQLIQRRNMNDKHALPWFCRFASCISLLGSSTTLFIDVPIIARSLLFEKCICLLTPLLLVDHCSIVCFYLITQASTLEQLQRSQASAKNGLATLQKSQALLLRSSKFGSKALNPASKRCAARTRNNIGDFLLLVQRNTHT